MGAQKNERFSQQNKPHSKKVVLDKSKKSKGGQKDKESLRRQLKEIRRNSKLVIQESKQSRQLCKQVCLSEESQDQALVSLPKIEKAIQKLKEFSKSFRQKYNVQLTESLMNCFQKQDISDIQMEQLNTNEETIDEIILALEPESHHLEKTFSRSNPFSEESSNQKPDSEDPLSDEVEDEESGNHLHQEEQSDFLQIQTLIQKTKQQIEQLNLND